MHCRILLLACTLLLWACEGPVDPAKIKLRGPGPITADGVYAVLLAPPAPGAVLHALPGERLTLEFQLINGVRDEIFLQRTDTTVYIASMLATTDRGGQLLPVNPPPEVDPRLNAAAYYRLAPRAANPSAPGESAATVKVPLSLPAGSWQELQLTIVFQLHGFVRTGGGEFRDTVSRVYRVQRK